MAQSKPRIPTTFDEYIVPFSPTVRAILRRNDLRLYPPVRGHASREPAVARCAWEKGNLRFPLDEPLPCALIERIAEHRVKQGLAKASAG
jgi:uncharacterized protein YdhG (YjbR/CyaY superfamily)